MDGAEAKRILDEHFPRKKRTIPIKYQTNRFNIIGFSEVEEKEHKTCPIDVGRRLEKNTKGELQCFGCGYIFRKEEAPTEQAIEPQHKKYQTAIVSAKRKKKYYADDGNEIKDPDLFGQHVVSYREELPK